MGLTQINTDSIKDGGINRADINTSATGNALITKVIQGTGLVFSSTGANPGTGDVTLALDVNNSNTWTAKQILQLASAQLRIGYDSSNYLDFFVQPVGGLLITNSTTTNPAVEIRSGSTNLRLASSNIVYADLTCSATGVLTLNPVTGNQIVLLGSVQTATTLANSNLCVSDSTNITTSTNSALLFAGGTTIHMRRFMRGSASTVIAASRPYGGTVFGTESAQIAASGTNQLFTSIVVNPVSIIATSGSGLLTASAGIYVPSAATGATDNYSIFVDSGPVRFDGNFNFNGTYGTSNQIVYSTGSAMAFSDLKTINSNSLFGSGNVAVGDALVANSLSQFAATSSSQLAGVISDETGTGLLVFASNPTLSGLTIADATNIVLNTTTGTKIGTSTSQKLAFFNSTPIVQPTGDIFTALANLGLISSATATTIANGGTGKTSIGTNKFIISQNGTSYVEGTAFLNSELTYSITSSIVITGTAPTGTLTATYRWQQIGSFVSARFWFSWATQASDTSTQLSFDLPADMPAPEKPSGFTANNNNTGTGFGGVATSNTANILVSRVNLSNSTASSTGYSVNMVYTTNNIKVLEIMIMYYTASGI
jgi:hypothetical protein